MAPDVPGDSNFLRDPSDLDNLPIDELFSQAERGDFQSLAALTRVVSDSSLSRFLSFIDDEKSRKQHDLVGSIHNFAIVGLLANGSSDAIAAATQRFCALDDYYRQVLVRQWSSQVDLPTCSNCEEE